MHYIILLLLTFISYSALGSSSAVVENDSLRHANLEEWLRSMVRLSNQYHRIDRDSSILFAEKGLVFARVDQYPLLTIELYRSKGYAQTLQGEYSDAMHTFDKALELSKNASLSQSIARLYNNKAIVYKNLGKFPEALSYYQQSFELKRQAGDSTGMANTTGNMANLYRRIGEESKAIASFRNLILLFETLKDSMRLGYTYHNLGSTYSNSNLDSALFYFEASYKLSHQLNDEFGQTKSLNTISKIYLLKENFEEAEKAARRALALAFATKSMEEVCRSYDHLSNINLKLGNLSKAYAYSDSSYTLARTLENRELLYNCIITFSEVESSRKNYQRSLKLYKESVSYKDSMISFETEQKIAQLKLQYAFDEKERLLRSQSEAQLSKQRWIISLISLLAIMLFLLIFYMFDSNKRLKRAYEELTEASKEIESLNSNLQKRVDERTQHLEYANKKLLDYAFANSHYVRKPVANILGLVDLLINSKTTDAQDNDIKQHLLDSSKELDEILITINEKLEKEHQAES